MCMSSPSFQISLYNKHTLHHLSIYPRDIHPGQTSDAKEYNSKQRREEVNLSDATGK